jgi:hypothetical protein
MPPSGAYKYIVQARCSLSYYPEFRMLRAETARMPGDWIYEDILFQWGSLYETVTDNHIWISGYNSQANGTVEHSHVDICQSLFKVVNSDQK